MDVSPDDPRLSSCEEHLGYRFRNRRLLALALTHSSDKATHIEAAAELAASPEAGVPAAPLELVDNERLEFFGDSILGMIVCEELFRRFPEATEGDLTNIKSVVVSRPILAKISDRLGIAEFMSLGKGMTTYSKLPESLRANVFEAVVAAMYIDGGLDPVRQFVLAHQRPLIEQVEQDQHRANYKSTLQQYTQHEFGITPTYRVISEEGPDHIKMFEVVAIVGERECAAGRGKSKKDAEQEAAKNTLDLLLKSAETPEPPPGP
jgi:ribonuclease-3